MEVIEFCAASDARHREQAFIDSFVNDPMCLNKHKTALGDGARRKLTTQEHHKKNYIPHPRVLKEKLPKIYKPLQNKSVVKYDANGIETCRFLSITAAARDAGILRDSMSDHLKRVKLKSGKPFYRLADDTRRYMVGKKEPKPPLKYPEMSGGKFVLDTKTGVFYYSVKDLCDVYGFSHKRMCDKLSGSRRNNTHFVYA
jgi:hypothetical protein